jgi:hypothetical protein
MKTYMSTDWIKVHDHDSTYLTRVFLTDNDEAYMIVKAENKTRFFKIKAELFRLGEIGFFEKLWKAQKNYQSHNQYVILEVYILLISFSASTQML